VKINADGEVAFNAGEEAFAAGEWDKAAANYQRAATTSARQWVKDRSSLRLVASAEKSGKFGAAVAGWATLLARDPVMAAKYKPQIPANAKPGSLDPAVAEVERALGDARLPAEPRQTLMAFQMELARANGDVKRAQAIGTKITTTGGTGGTTPELALQMAFLALDQKQYDQAAKTIEGAAASFNEPEQQAEALYCLAEAKAATAKDEASLKDAGAGVHAGGGPRQDRPAQQPPRPRRPAEDGGDPGEVGGRQGGAAAVPAGGGRVQGHRRRQKRRRRSRPPRQVRRGAVSSALLSSKDLSTPNRRSTQRE
jgi:tetratricopeptide (TPR) repeat protein